MDTIINNSLPCLVLNPATLKAPTYMINAASFQTWRGSQKDQSIRTGPHCRRQDCHWTIISLFWLRPPLTSV